MSTYLPTLGATAIPKRIRIGTVSQSMPTPRYSKGPNMFKRMIKGLVTWSMSNHHEEEMKIAHDREEFRISATGIRFEVYRANGGTVVETRRNDRRTGDSLFELHVISSDQDIGEEIGKIITMEALKA
jgi:hypothetical protein